MNDLQKAVYEKLDGMIIRWPRSDLVVYSLLREDEERLGFMQVGPAIIKFSTGDQKHGIMIIVKSFFSVGDTLEKIDVRVRNLDYYSDKPADGSFVWMGEVAAVAFSNLIPNSRYQVNCALQ